MKQLGGGTEQGLAGAEHLIEYGAFILCVDFFHFLYRIVFEILQIILEQFSYGNDIIFQVVYCSSIYL